MPIIGVKHPIIAVLTEGVSDTYASGQIMGKAMLEDINFEFNDQEVAGDDDIQEVDKSFVSGSGSIQQTDLSDTIQALILGHTITDGELIANVDDSAPYCGHGFYAKKKVDGVYKWRAIWFPKAIFGEPGIKAETKGRSITFQTPTVSYEIMRNRAGAWKREKTFDTEAEAVAYLDAFAGITPMCTKPTANVASGEYASTQTVTLSGAAGETIYYTTNGTTPSATNGSTYSSPISIAASCALKAIAIKSGQSNSPVATYEYIITA